jgi:FlaA1/EpsC-like NDP-sugar epimerase
MDQKKSLMLWMELIWWIMTGVIVAVVLYPIHKAMYSWQFERSNILFIVVLLTLSRYMFLLKYTFLADQQEVKVGLMILMFPLIFMLIGSLNTFMVYIEEKTWEPFTGHLPVSDRFRIERYIWGEMLFFGAGSILASILFIGRMMRSVWMYRNRGIA